MVVLDTKISSLPSLESLSNSLESKGDPPLKKPKKARQISRPETANPVGSAAFSTAKKLIRGIVNDAKAALLISSFKWEKHAGVCCDREAVWLESG